MVIAFWVSFGIVVSLLPLWLYLLLLLPLLPYANSKDFLAGLIVHLGLLGHPCSTLATWKGMGKQLNWYKLPCGGRILPPPLW